MKNKDGKTPEWVRDTSSLATLGAAGVLTGVYVLGNALENIQDAVYLGRHAAYTGVDALRGGPSGMRAAKNLEDALTIVDAAKDDNEAAQAALNELYATRTDLVQELATVYQQNETVGQEAGRLKLQLEGMISNVFQAGNDLKPGFMTPIDNWILRVFGQNPDEARAENARLDEFYKEVLKFYNSREKNEATVTEFCDYLAKVQTESTEQNVRLNELFPTVIARVKEGYETEDILLDSGVSGPLGIGRRISQKDLESVGGHVDQYQENVDTTRATVGQQVPLQNYGQFTLPDLILNPVVVGLTAALAAKGLSKGFPRIIERPFTTLTAAPILGSYAAGVWGAKKAVVGAKSAKAWGKRYIQKVRAQRD